MHHVTGMSDRECRVCVAALSNPGGLFLDIKSVYSSPADIECFISSLAGIGVETRALMTFQTSQRIAQAPTVFLQHGVWGLESACDAGYIRPGDLVLFNGGSLLNDPDRPGDWSTDEYRQKLIDKLAERGTKDKNVTRKIEAIRNSTRHQVRGDSRP